MKIPPPFPRKGVYSNHWHRGVRRDKCCQDIGTYRCCCAIGVRPVSAHVVDEVANHRRAVCRQHTLRMELHAVVRSRSMPHRHYDAVFRPRSGYERVHGLLRVDVYAQRVVSHDVCFSDPSE